MTAPSWLPLATTALNAAIREDRGRAEQSVTELGTHYHQDMPNVLLCWIDSVRHHRPTVHAPEFVTWLRVDTGQVQNANEVPPPVRWAGRLMLARAQGDADQFRALINAVSSDDEWSRNVVAVLEICALMLRAPRNEMYRPE